MIHRQEAEKRRRRDLRKEDKKRQPVAARIKLLFVYVDTWVYARTCVYMRGSCVQEAMGPQRRMSRREQTHEEGGSDIM